MVVFSIIQNSVIINSSIQKIDIIDQRINKWLQQIGVKSPLMDNVMLAVHEAVVNPEEGPGIAVVPAEKSGQPQLVLITSLDLNRETVNRVIREAGLSGLHSIREVRVVDALPLLGTGKTDYRALEAELE